jgi:hypothetical protein
MIGRSNMNERINYITFHYIWDGGHRGHDRMAVGFTTTCGMGLGLWCLMPLSTIFQLYRGNQLIGGGSWSTRRKLPICRKSLIYCVT